MRERDRSTHLHRSRRRRRAASSSVAFRRTHPSRHAQRWVQSGLCARPCKAVWAVPRHQKRVQGTARERGLALRATYPRSMPHIERTREGQNCTARVALGDPCNLPSESRRISVHAGDVAEFCKQSGSFVAERLKGIYLRDFTPSAPRITFTFHQRRLQIREGTP